MERPLTRRPGPTGRARQEAATMVTMAWWTRFYDGDDCMVVWADTRGKARRLAARELGDEWEWFQIQAKRLPAADGLSEGDLTPQWWLDNGFWIRCSWCEASIHGTDEGAILTEHGAYCNQRCQDCEEESRAKYRARSAEIAARLAQQHEARLCEVPS